MARKDISNYRLTSSSHLKLKFTLHFLKSSKQTGIFSISTFWETFSTFRNTEALLESTLIVALKKSSQTQWMPTEYNKSHIQGILKKNGKNTTKHNFVLFVCRRYFKNSSIRFHQGFQFKHSKTIKALGLRPHAFISFLVFENPDETRCTSFWNSSKQVVVVAQHTQ